MNNSFNVEKLSDTNFRATSTSKALAMIRFPLALCIVAVHWFNWNGIVPTVGYDLNTTELPILKAVLSVLHAFLSENGVASFFFISSYLFFVNGHWGPATYKEKLQRRVTSLLIPYLLWNLITVAFFAAHYLPVFKDLFPRMYALGFQMTWADFFKGFLITPAPHNSNLWFIRELMTCVILAPVFYYLLKKLPRLTLIVLCIVSVYAAYVDILYFQLLTWAMAYFALGSLMGIHQVDLVKLAKGKGWLAFSVFFVCGIINLLTITDMPLVAYTAKFLSLPAVILWALSIAGWCVTEKKLTANKFLTGSTFFVFVFHPLVMSHFTMFLARAFKPQSDISITVIYFIGYFVLLGLILAFYKLLQMICPRVVSVLSGRRG
jgi:hypothetical protein